MEEKKPVDRRKYVRLSLEAKVHCHLQVQRKERGASKKFSGISKNISVEGICFTSEKKIKANSKLVLEIWLPFESNPLHLEGEVKWSHLSRPEENKGMFDTGVKLFTIDKSDEDRFIEYVCDKMTERLSRYLHL